MEGSPQSWGQGTFPRQQSGSLNPSPQAPPGLWEQATQHAGGRASKDKRLGQPTACGAAPGHPRVLSRPAVLQPQRHCTRPSPAHLDGRSSPQDTLPPASDALQAVHLGAGKHLNQQTLTGTPGSCCHSHTSQPSHWRGPGIPVLRLPCASQETQQHPGLHPHDASGTPTPRGDNQMSPDIATCGVEIELTRRGDRTDRIRMTGERLS